MSADATGIFILTGEQTPSLRKTLARAFSPPLAPTFGERREDNRIRLRLFCFLPVNLSFIAAFAALKVSLWRRMSADATGIFILTGDNALPLTAFALAFSPVDPLSENDGKTTTLLRKKLVRLFSPREPLFHRRVRGS